MVTEALAKNSPANTNGRSTRLKLIVVLLSAHGVRGALHLPHLQTGTWHTAPTLFTEWDVCCILLQYARTHQLGHSVYNAENLVVKPKNAILCIICDDARLAPFVAN
jgi:hypothetical protein